MTDPNEPVPVPRGILTFIANTLQLVAEDSDKSDLLSRASNGRAMLVSSCPGDMFDGDAQLVDTAANEPTAPVLPMMDTVRYVIKGEDVEFEVRSSFVPGRHDVIHLPDSRRARRSGSADVHWVAQRVVEVHVVVDGDGT